MGGVGGGWISSKLKMLVLRIIDMHVSLRLAFSAFSPTPPTPPSPKYLMTAKWLRFNAYYYLLVFYLSVAGEMVFSPENMGTFCIECQ